ncbi:MAG: ChbG/HpnK family deacetylase [Elusimicrobia bacterium]|nr:ChbG/HpnK family deacetylase [Elusimicrobiota bacterium]
MKRVIINGDDFGLTEGVNRGIIEAHREGILTSATILANGVAFGGAVRLAGENAGLGIGIHLNISCGKPVLPAEDLPCLTRGTGKFMRNKCMLFYMLMTGMIDTAEIEREFRAQAEKLISSGIRPGHIDTHHNVHAVPAVLDIVMRLSKEYGISGIRSLSNPSCAGRPAGAGCFIGHPIIRFLARREKEALRAGGISFPDRIFGMWEYGRMTGDRLNNIFASLPDGTSEIVCHPGYTGSADAGEYEDRLFYAREAELGALREPSLRDRIRALEIDLAGYGSLK